LLRAASRRHVRPLAPATSLHLPVSPRRSRTSGLYCLQRDRQHHRRALASGRICCHARCTSCGLLRHALPVAFALPYLPTPAAYPRHLRSAALPLTPASPPRLTRAIQSRGAWPSTARPRATTRILRHSAACLVVSHPSSAIGRPPASAPTHTRETCGMLWHARQTAILRVAAARKTCGVLRYVWQIAILRVEGERETCGMLRYARQLAFAPLARARPFHPLSRLSPQLPSRGLAPTNCLPSPLAWLTADSRSCLLLTATGPTWHTISECGTQI
jgi:hypothetical protein